MQICINPYISIIYILLYAGFLNSYWKHSVLTRVRVFSIFIFCITLFAGKAYTSHSHVSLIKICVDNSNWVPYIYQEDTNLTGLHIAIITNSLKELGIPYRFFKVPWKRCLKGLEKGTYDAVATASYNKQRNKFLIYPEDSQGNIRSEWRVGQVEYIIATHVSNPYQFSPDWKTLPKPIRVPRGYSIGQDIRKQGINIDDSALNDMQNIKRLIREKTGSVVTLSSIIDWYKESKEDTESIKYHQQPLKSKSYFFAFSRNGSVSSNNAVVIWNKIKQDRETINEQYINNLSKSMK